MNEFVVPVSEEITASLKWDFAFGEIVDWNPDGSPIRYNTRALVDRFEGLKVEIFANDHPPPHFRVKYQDSTANFRISDCRRMNGKGKILRYQKNIEFWWGQNKQKLISEWNARRPGDCPVGEYHESNI